MLNDKIIYITDEVTIIPIPIKKFLGKRWSISQWEAQKDDFKRE